MSIQFIIILIFKKNILFKKKILVDIFMFLSIIQIIFRHVKLTTLNQINFCII